MPLTPNSDRRRRPRAVLLAAVGLTLALGGAVWTSLVAGPAGTGPAQAASPAAAQAAPRPPESTETLQGALRADPDDWRSWARLGLAYVEDARVTANPALYPKAQGALERSLELKAEGNASALIGRAALANARHDFAEGLEWGERARSTDGGRAEAHGVIGDSLVELGRYDDAFAAYQQMVDLAPGLASYTRAAYALELQGDVDGARRTLELALGAAVAPKDMAFAHHSLGELAWHSGDIGEARSHYEQSTRLDPAFVPPQAGLARVEAASGDAERAISRWKAVADRSPLPEYVAELADLYLATGRPAEAEQQFALLQAQRALLEANGVNVELELALFSADHGVDLHEGLRAAESEWRRRKSIHVADALAWQLHAHGRHREALEVSDEALRLGTRNALFLFHRGMIHQSLGDERAARADLERAMATNPHFSILHAPAAARALAAVEAG